MAQAQGLEGLQGLEAPADVRRAGRWARIPLIIAGVFLVVLGTIGIFVPLLPSTIFYLLAAGAFGRSSPSAYRWLTTNRFFGSRLRQYREERGATVATKVTSLVSLWAGLAIADWLTGFQPWIGLALLAVGIGVSAHLLMLRTIPTRGRGT